MWTYLFVTRDLTLFERKTSNKVKYFKKLLYCFKGSFKLVSRCKKNRSMETFLSISISPKQFGDPY